MLRPCGGCRRHHARKVISPIEDIADFEDIANAVWYFASDASKNTTGAELTVDGGMLAQLTPNIERDLWTEKK